MIRRTDAFKRTIARLALLGTAVAVLPLAATAPAAAATPKPDLVVTAIKIGLPGSPPYIALGHSGLAPRFVISVTTKNQGRATAGASVTLVRLDQGSLHRHARLHLKPIAPGASRTASWTVENFKPLLGFVSVEALADADYLIKESNELNNLRHGQRIDVIARTWDVTRLKTDTNVPGAEDSNTAAQSGFYFRFVKLDASTRKFVYEAIGPVKESFTVSNTCNGAGSKTVTRDPWAKSQLWIATNLKAYHALVMASVLPSFTVTVTCPGLTYQAPASFADIGTITGQGSVVMTPDDTGLQGSKSDKALFTTYSWTFRADVP